MQPFSFFTAERENGLSGIKIPGHRQTAGIFNNRGGIFFELAFLVLAVIFFAGILQKWFLGMNFAPIGFNWTESNFDAGEQSQIGNVNVLVLGVDSVDGTHRADTIFVLGINPSKHRVNMISIPRDTRVLINGRGRKINEILPRYGVEVLKSLLEDLLHIQIGRHVEVGFQSFVNIIDIIGGLDIDIEKPMHYDDNWGKVHIHFEPGINHLDGRKALNYVRFRADAAADLGRIKRQQKFVKVLLEKALTPAVVVKLPQIISEVYRHIDTDFTLAEIYALARSFKNLKVDFRNSSLPGEARYVDKISFFMPYQDEAMAIGTSQFSDLAAVELVASFSTVASVAIVDNVAVASETLQTSDPVVIASDTANTTSPDTTNEN